MARRLAVLGSTGSIGRQALEVASSHPDRITVVALAAGGALEPLCEQARAFRPAAIALERAADPAAARALLGASSPGARVEVGAGAAARLVAHTDCDTVLNGLLEVAPSHRPLSRILLLVRHRIAGDRSRWLLSFVPRTRDVRRD